MLAVALILLNCQTLLCKETRTEKASPKDLVLPDSDKLSFHYLPPPTSTILSTNLDQTGPILFRTAADIYNTPQRLTLPTVHDSGLQPIAEANPLLAALLLRSTLGISPKAPGFNHPQHLPINPYLALLLSHYGRYIPVYGLGRGIYGYTAANNYHNNQPFGAYKIYEDRDI